MAIDWPDSCVMSFLRGCLLLLGSKAIAFDARATVATFSPSMPLEHHGAISSAARGVDT